MKIKVIKKWCVDKSLLETFLRAGLNLGCKRMLYATPIVFPLRGKRQIRNVLKRQNREQNNRTHNCGKTILHATRRIPPFTQQHFSLLIGYVYQCGLQYVHCRDNCGWVFYVPILVRFIKQCLFHLNESVLSLLTNILHSRNLFELFDNSTP